MNPRRAIFGEIAQYHFVRNVGARVTGIDAPALLSRLLFFDEVIVRSVQLQEVPFLVKLFGVEGFQELMRSGTLKLSCEVMTTALDSHINGKRELPLMEFRQAIVDTPDHREYIRPFASHLLAISGLQNKDREELFSEIASRLVRPLPTHRSELLGQIRKDLTSNFELLRVLLARADRSLELAPNAIAIRVEQVAPGTQRFSSNLRELTDISPEKEHQLFSKVATAVANLNQRLADMQSYSAISSFETSEAPLLFGKIHGILAPLNPSFEEEAFLRILTFTDIPEYLVSGRIDVEKLLLVRSSSECREFKHWLSTTTELNDAQVKGLVAGLRARTASFLASPTGKTVRFITNAALGFIPHYGTVSSLAEGAVDSFLLDKLLPSSGILIFLSQQIPSVFDRAYGKAGGAGGPHLNLKTKNTGAPHLASEMWVPLLQGPHPHHPAEPPSSPIPVGRNTTNQHAFPPKRPEGPP